MNLVSIPESSRAVTELTAVMRAHAHATGPTMPRPGGSPEAQRLVKLRDRWLNPPEWVE